MDRAWCFGETIAFATCQVITIETNDLADC
jgi:hypothetical protein